LKLWLKIVGFPGEKTPVIKGIISSTRLMWPGENPAGIISFVGERVGDRVKICPEDRKTLPEKTWMGPM